jgi:predicted nucleotidyltransferase
VFTPEERSALRERLLERAREDDRVTGAAVTGSAATDDEDRWSDVDIFLGIAENADIDTVLADWTHAIYTEDRAVAHWDLRAPAALYRVFLLDSCLQVDVAFTPESKFGPGGPRFRTVFGDEVAVTPAGRPTFDDVTGLGWLGVLHANAAVERGRLWEAEYWVSSVRDQALSLACLRFGESPSYARGYDRLSKDVTAPYEDGLVRSLEARELRRALAAVTTRLLHEIRSEDAALADGLEGPLLEVAGG